MAYKNAIHKVLGQATELARTCNIQQYRISEAAVLLGQKQAEIDSLKGQVEGLQDMLRQSSNSFSDKEIELAMLASLFQEKKSELRDLKVAYESVEVERDSLKAEIGVVPATKDRATIIELRVENEELRKTVDS